MNIASNFVYRDGHKEKFERENILVCGAVVERLRHQVHVWKIVNSNAPRVVRSSLAR